MSKYKQGKRIGKRAQAETQLNWIFILIVGAVILAFFTFIVIKQRSASEAQFSGKVSQQLNTILVGAKVASGSVQQIPTPDLEIRFTCNDYFIGPASQRLGNRIVFAPEFLEGNNLITWTLDWNSPFKVTSFLYITTPRIRYIVVGNDPSNPLAKAVLDGLPEMLAKQRLSWADFSEGRVRFEGDTHVRFIFVGFDVGSTIFTIPDSLDDVPVSGLVVNGGVDEGSVTFLERSAADDGRLRVVGADAHRYIEREMLYGAVFSTKEPDFVCLQRRAYDRLNLVARVYFEKFNAIQPVYAGTRCEGFYRNNVDLQELIAATATGEVVDYDSILSVKSKLQGSNQRLQLYSCPLLY